MSEYYEWGDIYKHEFKPYQLVLTDDERFLGDMTFTIMVSLFMIMFSFAIALFQ